MKIACIGWGSLIWNRGDLKIKGDWSPDGPLLPVEFARTSQDGRLTLVIVEGVPPVQTLWAEMDCTDLQAAVDSLRQRENIGPRSAAEFIGVLRADDHADDAIKTVIKAWIISKDIDAVIWTNLPSKFADVNHRMPTEAEAVSHLQGLSDEQLKKAALYIINTPKQIETPYRAAFRERLGISE